MNDTTIVYSDKKHKAYTKLDEILSQLRYNSVKGVIRNDLLYEITLINGAYILPYVQKMYLK